MNYLMRRSFLGILLFMFYNGDLAWSLRLLSMRVDTHVVIGSSTTLDCVYDLESEALYSVKWYKDGNEFYRYIPNDQPQTQVYPLPGVHVDKYHSNSSHISLLNISLSSSGRYRCEVSAEGPSFQTVTDHGDMLAVALPEKGPTITGGRARYTEGDRVGVNCTSGASKPATQLTWFINGEPVNASSPIIRGPWREYFGQEGLETTTLGLVFKVSRRHFRRGDLKVKCVATIASIYWKSNEESSEAERQQRQHPAEVKYSDTASPSRADTVKASSIRPGCHPYLIVAAVTLLSLGFHRVIIR